MCPLGMRKEGIGESGISCFSPSERSFMRVRRSVPEERVVARMASVGCQDMEVSVIVLVGREWIGWEYVCSVHRVRKVLKAVCLGAVGVEYARGRGRQCGGVEFRE
jgi:hypothetical protein